MRSRPAGLHSRIGPTTDQRQDVAQDSSASRMLTIATAMNSVSELLKDVVFSAISTSVWLRVDVTNPELTADMSLESGSACWLWSVSASVVRPELSSATICASTSESCV